MPCACIGHSLANQSVLVFSRLRWVSAGLNSHGGRTRTAAFRPALPCAKLSNRVPQLPLGLVALVLRRWRVRGDLPRWRGRKSRRHDVQARMAGLGRIQSNREARPPVRVRLLLCLLARQLGLGPTRLLQGRLYHGMRLLSVRYCRSLLLPSMCVRKASKATSEGDHAHDRQIQPYNHTEWVMGGILAGAEPYPPPLLPTLVLCCTVTQPPEWLHSRGAIRQGSGVHMVPGHGLCRRGIAARLGTLRGGKCAHDWPSPCVASESALVPYGHAEGGSDVYSRVSAPDRPRLHRITRTTALTQTADEATGTLTPRSGDLCELVTRSRRPDSCATKMGVRI